MTDLFSEVKEIIHQVSGTDKDTIKLESNLLTDLKIDSLDFLDITFEVDKKFGISLPVEEWVREASAQTDAMQEIFTLQYFLNRIQQIIDEKK